MVYLKTSSYTNAAACLINVLSLNDSTYKPKEEDEYKIWLSSVVLPTRACSIFGLASVGLNYGLNVKVFTESLEFDYPDYRFHRYKKSDIELAKKISELYVEKSKKEGIEFNVGEVRFEKLKELLVDNYLIVRINTKDIRNLKKNNSNYVVFLKYEDKMYEIIDPSQGNISVDEELAKESYVSLETKKHRSHNVLCIEKK